MKKIRRRSSSFTPPSMFSMSLRDVFASAALQGMLTREGPPVVDNYDADDFARMSYELADAMLLERAPAPNITVSKERLEAVRAAAVAHSEKKKASAEAKRRASLKHHNINED